MLKKTSTFFTAAVIGLILLLFIDIAIIDVVSKSRAINTNTQQVKNLNEEIEAQNRALVEIRTYADTLAAQIKSLGAEPIKLSEPTPAPVTTTTNKPVTTTSRPQVRITTTTTAKRIVPPTTTTTVTPAPPPAVTTTTTTTSVPRPTTTTTVPKTTPTACTKVVVANVCNLGN